MPAISKVKNKESSGPVKTRPLFAGIFNCRGQITKPPNKKLYKARAFWYNCKQYDLCRNFSACAPRGAEERSISMNTNLAYQQEPWEELVGGKVVAMSPRPSVNHNRVAVRARRGVRQRVQHPGRLGHRDAGPRPPAGGHLHPRRPPGHRPLGGRTPGGAGQDRGGPARGRERGIKSAAAGRSKGPSRCFLSALS